MSRIFLILLVLLVGCKNKEQSMLEDITETTYAAGICKGDCDSIQEAVYDAVTKANIAGIDQTRILSAQEFGRVKANRELIKIAKREDKLESDNKTKMCESENKRVCSGGICCSWEAYQRELRENAAAPASDYATAMAAAEDAATASDEEAATASIDSNTATSDEDAAYATEPAAETAQDDTAKPADNEEYNLKLDK